MTGGGQRDQRFHDAAQARIPHHANQADTLKLVVADARLQRDVPVRRPQRKDLYEVLEVGRSATDEEIKKAFHRMALKYHPDKNGDDPVAFDIFLEIQFAHSILSDPSKRRQYDKSGFEAIESDRPKSDLDLSNLSPASTMFVALLSKFGVPIKTTVPVAVLKEALDRSVKVFQLQLGQSERRKVEKLSANYYAVDITERDAKAGLVCRVHSPDGSKFKLLYFTCEENGGLDLALKEDSVDTGNGTSAGMYFLGFPVYRFQHNYSPAVIKNSHTVLLKMLDSFQSCDVNELTPGTHYFAVYGDNFFRPASYIIEFMCGQSFSAEKEKLKNVEAMILAKQAAYREMHALVCRFHQISLR
ncbi:chaperone protein dnaJ 16 isoform X2 [Triticum aestivum]|uniref:chaperone protein dnaJ 16 isoform X2 n=1 Tax=Triticum aestivum TaxID=4565 RepID=UPI001D0064AB|nr:chaperone protein dnaJ 16-like isoform X2 [Triticum aestivum]